MKKVLASLLAAYTLTNAQGPPGTTAGATTNVVDPVPPAVDPVVIPPGPPVEIPPITPPGPPVDPVTPVTPGTTATGATTVQVSPAPTTPTPTTPAPTTGAPTTAAPTYNPYCPMPTELGGHGVTSGGIMSSNQGCISPFERAVAFNGKLQCSKFACCQCAEIQCGDPFGLACDEIIISDSGAVGNQNINVLGDMTSAFNGNSFAGIGGAMNNGAQIGCNGVEACKASRIKGKYVGQVKCAGDMGCAGANILLEDPGNELQVQCNGMMSCMNTNLEILITQQSQVFELGTIEFNGQQAAQGMTITIRNEGFNPVLLQNLECMNPTACPNLRINIIGQVFIENCDLQHMNIQSAGPSLLAACQAGQGMQSGFLPQVPYNPVPQVPQVPQVPANPVNPVTPPVNQQPATPVAPAPGTGTPAAPAPPAQLPPVQPVGPAMPFIPTDPHQLKCEFNQCRNRIINITPMGMWKLICDLPGQCDGMTLNLNVAGGAGGFAFGFGTEIDVLKFSVATRGVTININGFVDLQDIRCEKVGSCTGLTINAPQVDLYGVNMDCQHPGSCMQCSMNNMDCNALAAMGGNTGGFGMGYYGQPAAPQYPQYPQYQQPYYNPYI